MNWNEKLVFLGLKHFCRRRRRHYRLRRRHRRRRRHRCRRRHQKR